LKHVTARLSVCAYRHLRREDSHRRMEQINFLGSDDEEELNNDAA